MHTVCSVVQQLVSGQRWETGELRCLAAAAAAVDKLAAAAVAAAVLDKAHPTIGQSASHSPTLSNVNFGEPALLMLNLRLVTNQRTSFVSIRVLDTGRPPESNPKIVTQNFEPLI